MVCNAGVAADCVIRVSRGGNCRAVCILNRFPSFILFFLSLLNFRYQNELPKKIKSRGKDPHLTHEELVQTIKWKLAVSNHLMPFILPFGMNKSTKCALNVSISIPPPTAGQVPPEPCEPCPDEHPQGCHAGDQKSIPKHFQTRGPPERAHRHV